MERKSPRAADGFAYPPRMMDRERAAAYVGLGSTKFSELVKEGRLPKPVDLAGMPRWDRFDLDHTMDDLREIAQDRSRSMLDKALDRLERGQVNEIAAAKTRIRSNRHG